MSFVVRRWLARPGTRWVLAALLGLALFGAQTLATRHELSHLFGDAQALELAAAAGSSHDQHGTPDPAQADHLCPLLLLAAALGGAAAGPMGLHVAAVDAAADSLSSPVHAFAPRFTRAYASRAPPASIAIG